MSESEVRLGRWQDVLADVECDALIFDAPYGKRTHLGHDSMEGTKSIRAIGYDHLTADDVREIADHWSPRCRGWFVTMTSHDLIPAWEQELERHGRYVFAPLPFVDVGRGTRLAGDGPASWSVFIVVARPRTIEYARWGALPGAYLRTQGDRRSTRMGGKPLGVMRRIVRDYSRRGDLVCDPFAGHGTTLIAAVLEGRRAIGSEVDHESYQSCVDKLAGAPSSAGQDGTLALFGGSAP